MVQKLSAQHKKGKKMTLTYSPQNKNFPLVPTHNVGCMTRVFCLVQRGRGELLPIVFKLSSLCCVWKKKFAPKCTKTTICLHIYGIINCSFKMDHRRIKSSRCELGLGTFPVWHRWLRSVAGTLWLVLSAHKNKLIQGVIGSNSWQGFLQHFYIMNPSLMPLHGKLNILNVQLQKKRKMLMWLSKNASRLS